VQNVTSKREEEQKRPRQAKKFKKPPSSGLLQVGGGGGGMLSKPVMWGGEGFGCAMAEKRQSAKRVLLYATMWLEIS
jgi:hypothetical protein